MPTDAQTLIDLVATQGYEKLSRRELIECILAAAQGGSSGTPAYQDMQVAWTPANLKLGEMIGYFCNLDFGVTPLPGITTLIFSATQTLAGFQITDTPNLLSIDFPNLTSILSSIGFDSTKYRGLSINNNSSLTSVSAPLLASMDSTLNMSNNPLLTSINIASLITVGVALGFSVEITGNASLTTLSLPLWLPSNGGKNSFTGNAFSAATVNSLLARAVANAAFVSGRIDLSGGTNAAPTGQGVIDKATLNARLAGLAVTN